MQDDLVCRTALGMLNIVWDLIYYKIVFAETSYKFLKHEYLVKIKTNGQSAFGSF